MFILWTVKENVRVLKFGWEGGVSGGRGHTVGVSTVRNRLQQCHTRYLPCGHQLKHMGQRFEAVQQSRQTAVQHHTLGSTQSDSSLL